MSFTGWGWFFIGLAAGGSLVFLWSMLAVASHADDQQEAGVGPCDPDSEQEKP